MAGAFAASDHSCENVLPDVNRAAGSEFVKHSGVWPGVQYLPVVPTSAFVPWIATQPMAVFEAKGSWAAGTWPMPALHRAWALGCW